MDGNGTPQGSSGGFPIAKATTNLHVDPDVAYGAGYGYLVTWRYFDSGASGEDVYGRYVVQGQDSAAGDEFVIDDTEDAQRYPAVGCAPSGDCLVVEEDNYLFGVGTNDYEIRGRGVRPHHIYLPCALRNY